MALERVNGFVMTQDRVHGKPTWKVRIKQTGHEHDGKKCRVVSTHGGYEPHQSDAVSFLIGSTMENEQRILHAYDVAPIVEDKKPLPPKPSKEKDAMNWVITQTSDGEIHTACIGDTKIFREEAEASGERILALIPFDITEHIDKWDDDDTEGAFEIVRALTCTPATLQALEKLTTALVREAVKAKA